MAFRWSKRQRALRNRWIRFSALRLRCRGGVAGRNALRAALSEGFFHPEKMAALDSLAAMDGLGYATDDSGLVFMLQAHLWGAWAPLLAFRPDLAAEVRKRRGLLALAVTERESGSDLYGISSEIRERRGGWILNGAKTFVTNGPLAKGFLIVARHAGTVRGPRLSCFFVPAGTPGLVVKKSPALAALRSARLAELRFRNVLLGPDQLVGPLYGGADVFRLAMAWERGMILSSAAGRLERLLEKLLAAASKKSRGGKRLPDLPGFRERVARVVDCISEIRAGAGRAARILDTGGNAVRASMETKAQGSSRFVEASCLLYQLGGKEACFAGTELESNLLDSLASTFYSGPNFLLETVLSSLSRE